MTEVRAADRTTLLLTKREECGSTVRSRERKLRELFAVLTVAGGRLPSSDSAIHNAESRFLFQSDILEGRRLDESTIPAGWAAPTEALHRFFALSGPSSSERYSKPQQDAASPLSAPELASPSLPASAKVPRGPPSLQNIEKLQKPRVSEVQHGHTSSSLQPSDADPDDLAARATGPLFKTSDVVSGVPRPVPTEHGSSLTINVLQPPLEAIPTPPPSELYGPGLGSTGRAAADAAAARRSIDGIGKTATQLPNDKSPLRVAAPPPNSQPIVGMHACKTTPDTVNGTKDVFRTALNNGPEQENSGRPGPSQSSRGDPPQFPGAHSSPKPIAHATSITLVSDNPTDASPNHDGLQHPENQAGKSSEQTALPEDGSKETKCAMPDGQAESTSGPRCDTGEDRARSSSRAEAQLLREGAASAAAIFRGVKVTRQPQPGVVEHSLGTDEPRTSRQAAGDAGTADTGQAVQDKPSYDLRGSHLHPPQAGPSPNGGTLLRPRDRTTHETAPVSPLPNRSEASPSVQLANRGETLTSSTGKPHDEPRAGVDGCTMSPLAASPDPATLAPLQDHNDICALTPRHPPPVCKIPRVVFGHKVRPRDGLAAVPGRHSAAHLSSEDYFTTLFVQGFTQNAKWMKPMDVVLNQAHKTLNTSDSHLSILEQQACRVLRRVYHLQQTDKWTLRQPKRHPEPTRPPAHRELMLQEMKWMRTDFRQERKWKRVAASTLAQACAEWVAADAGRRRSMQVKAVVLTHLKSQEAGTRQLQQPSGSMLSKDDRDAQNSFLMATSGDHEDSLADNSGEQEEKHGEGAMATRSRDFGDNDEDDAAGVAAAVPSTTIFALADDEFVLGLSRSVASDQLLGEVPLYGPPLQVPKFDLTVPDCDPDGHWRRPALPLSRYVDRPMVLRPITPPTKRSRYQYLKEDDSSDEEGRRSGDCVVFDVNAPSASFGAATGPPVERENQMVALFNPEMQATRDRLHAGHQFRPPTEHPMPLQSFYEARNASQWTWAEDDELKALVREYSYNWSLISSMLTTRSLFSSGPERRTPWECFERWVQLEGLPMDMSKTQYFRTYQHRIDAAQLAIAQRNAAIAANAAATATQTGQGTLPPSGPGGTTITSLTRKRPTTTMRVERRRNNKHLALIDAMRKLAKKRETAAQKQQHAASMAAMRKANETQQQLQMQPSQHQSHQVPSHAQAQQPPRGPNKTPSDYSLMRWERDQQLTERMAQYAQKQQQQHEAQRKAALAARSQAQASSSSAAVAAASHSGSTGAPSSSIPPQLAAQMAHMAQITANSGANGVGRPPAKTAAQLAMAGRGRLPMQVAQNGMVAIHQTHTSGAGLVPALPLGGVSQGQMQPAHRMQIPGSNPTELNLLYQAQRIQSQQRSVQLQQQQHLSHSPQTSLASPTGQQQAPHPKQQSPQQQQQPTPPPPSQQQQQPMGPPLSHHQQQQQQQPQQPQSVPLQGSPAGLRNSLNGISNQQSYLANVASTQTMMPFNGAQQNSAGGATSPPLNAMVATGSPRGGHGIAQHNPQHPHYQHPHPHPHPQSAALAHFEAQIRVKFPALPSEQIRKLAQTSLEQRLVQQRNNAMSAAAGSSPKPNLVGAGHGGTPHQYAQLLLAQQHQAAVAAAALAGPGSASAQNGSDGSGTGSQHPHALQSPHHQQLQHQQLHQPTASSSTNP